MKAWYRQLQRRTLQVLIAAICSAAWSPTSTTAADVVTKFQETDETFANPGQGWMTTRRMPDGPGRFPYSVAYFRLNWEDIEPAEGQYNWQWANVGVGKLYRRYPLVLSLLDTTGAVVCQQAQADIDVISWLPGDWSVGAALRLPADLQAGQYTLGLALVDAASDKAAIRLAIDAPHTDRLYRLSSVRVE
jgi:hypothetical protein